MCGGNSVVKKNNNNNKESGKVRMIDGSNKNFCLFSRSKNKILDVDRDFIVRQGLKDGRNVANHQKMCDFDVATKAMFKEQSDTFYKKYLRNSTLQKKLTIQNIIKAQVH